MSNFEITVWPCEINQKYIYEYAAKITKGFSEARFYEGGGVSLYKSRARKRAICEAVERYCGSKVPLNLLKISYRKIRNKAVNPQRLILFDKKQYKSGFLYKSFNEHKSIEWVEGFSLTINKEILVPAFAVYLSYNRGIPKEDYLFPTLSCGLATERDYKKAVMHGIFELIERDAAMFTWINSVSPSRLNLNQITSKNLRYLVEQIKREGLCPVVCITTRDINIPSVIGIIYGPKENIPYASFGLATDISLERAALKSLEEALMVRNTLEFIQKSNQLKIKPKYQMIKTFLDHAVLYSFPETRNNWEFLLKGELLTSREVKIRFNFRKAREYSLDALISMLGNIRIEVIAIELTDSLSEAMNLKTVRVILPSIHQMDFDYNARFLGSDRIKKMAQRFKRASIRINPDPHPFA
jgi:ribosomal protein S12 methylthiotransferase accessory factor